MRWAEMKWDGMKDNEMKIRADCMGMYWIRVLAVIHLSPSFPLWLVIGWKGNEWDSVIVIIIITVIMLVGCLISDGITFDHCVLGLVSGAEQRTIYCLYSVMCVWRMEDVGWSIQHSAFSIIWWWSIFLLLLLLSIWLLDGLGCECGIMFSCIAYRSIFHDISSSMNQQHQKSKTLYVFFERAYLAILSQPH